MPSTVPMFAGKAGTTNLEIEFPKESAPELSRARIPNSLATLRMMKACLVARRLATIRSRPSPASWAGSPAWRSCTYPATGSRPSRRTWAARCRRAARSRSWGCRATRWAPRCRRSVSRDPLYRGTVLCSWTGSLGALLSQICQTGFYDPIGCTIAVFLMDPIIQISVVGCIIDSIPGLLCRAVGRRERRAICCSASAARVPPSTRTGV